MTVGAVDAVANRGRAVRHEPIPNDQQWQFASSDVEARAIPRDPRGPRKRLILNRSKEHANS